MILPPIQYFPPKRLLLYCLFLVHFLSTAPFLYFCCNHWVWCTARWRAKPARIEATEGTFSRGGAPSKTRVALPPLPVGSRLAADLPVPIFSVVVPRGVTAAAPRRRPAPRHRGGGGGGGGFFSFLFLFFLFFFFFFFCARRSPFKKCRRRALDGSSQMAILTVRVQSGR